MHEPELGEGARPSLVGRTLPGGLLLRERVGETSIGVIYRAESIDTRCEFQLVFLTGARDLTALRAQLTRAAAVAHPNVAAVKTLGDTPYGVPYIALEVLQGQLLSEMLQDRSTLPVAEAVDLILQAAAGLQAVHEAGLLHGNLSPKALVVTSGEEGRPLVKVIRFSLSGLESEPLLADESVAPFSAPERLVGHPPSVSGDIFSLGAILYHTLSGGMPSGLPPDVERDFGDLPSGVRAALRGALDPSPEHRLESVAAFRQLLQDGGSGGKRQEQRQLPRRSAGRYPRAALAGTLAALAAGAAWWAVRGQNGTEARPYSGDESAAVQITPSPPDTLPDTTASRAQRSDLRNVARAPRGARAAAAHPGKPKPKKVAAQPAESVMAGFAVGHAPESPAPAEQSPMSAPTPPAESMRPTSAPATTRLVSPTPTAPVQRAIPRDATAEAREAAGRTLSAYARALESSDLHAVEWIYPRITDRERTAWKKFFEVARDLAVNLNIERFALSGSEAQLDVEGTYRYWNRTLLRQEVTPVRFVATVKRDGDTWHVGAIR